jgi:Fe-S cluster assembly iron-binding protein IscA
VSSHSGPVFVLTENTIDIIEMLLGDDAALRLFVAGSRGAGLDVAIAHAPLPGDAVIDAQGVRIYVDAEAARRLDGKVLDAAVHERSVAFAVVERVRPRARRRRGPRPQLARWTQWRRASSAQ